MEISSHHQEGEIPIPINSAYGDGHHMNIHHHHHQQQHQPHNHMIINPNSSSTNIPPNNNGSSMPSSTTLHDEDDDDDDDEHGHDRDDDDDHIPVAAAVAAVAAVPSSFNNKKVVVHDPVVNTNNSNIIVRYRECLKNHAASMGTNATDGCGEFMPSGEDGTIEALKCSACNCHRNFHRKEIEGTGSINIGPSSSRKFILGSVPYHHHHHQNKGGNYPIPSRTVPPLIPSAHHHHQLIMPYNNNVMNMGSHHHDRDHQPELSEQHPHHQHGTGSLVVAARPPAVQGVTRKRFRTKFTQEQKEKMLNFAEKVGWKIQKQEESVVHQFCQEIGIKRRVLKVWMHNNKHNLAKKNNLPSS